MASKRREQKHRQIITQQRMEALFRFANIQAHHGHPDRACRCMEHVRNLSTKNLTPIPTEWKHRMCKYCHQFLIPGETCRIRIHRHKIILFCTQCSSYYRIPLTKREKKAAILI